MSRVLRIDKLFPLLYMWLLIAAVRASGNYHNYRN